MTALPEEKYQGISSDSADCKILVFSNLKNRFYPFLNKSVFTFFEIFIFYSFLVSQFSYQFSVSKR